jgi:hypothetical protein
MFAATTDDVLTIKLALQSARASSDAVDARGVGAAMAPFSLASFYNGCMAVLPVDPFAHSSRIMGLPRDSGGAGAF